MAPVRQVWQFTKTALRRAAMALVCLWLLAAALFGGLDAYFGHSPDARERLEITERTVDDDLAEDAGFLTRIAAIATAWWKSDELLAEERADKALAEKARAEAAREAESRRFNENEYDDNEDFYPPER